MPLTRDIGRKRMCPGTPDRDVADSIEEFATTILRACRGRALRLAAGDILRVINTYGSQVVDTWAFNPADPAEFMSMAHSRTAIERITPRIGDALVTNRRRAILTLVADTSPGVHDTLIAACDADRYRILCGDEAHANCAANLATALASIGVAGLNVVPCPLNLFMNVSNDGHGKLALCPTLSSPGDYVDLRAEMDAIVVVSACPQDVSPVNGLRPRDIELSLRRAGTGFA